ncbi:hypothetical protein CHUAL_004266 [Chamberlinius hualienensis]
MSHSVIEQEDQYLQELTLNYYMQALTPNSEESTMDTGSESNKREIVPVPTVSNEFVHEMYRERRQKENSRAKRLKDKRRAIFSSIRSLLAEKVRIYEEREHEIAVLKHETATLRRECLTRGIKID